MAYNAKIHPQSTRIERSGVLQPPRKHNFYQKNSQQGNIQQQQTVVVVTQPRYAGQAERRPPNYLPGAIFVACCCCFWTGITAITYAREANNLAAKGDMKGAQKKAKSARNCIIFSFVFGVAMIIAIIVVSLVY